ncbi:hypothetical protein VITU102760_24905 [Vibrio tubiashii]|uniref:Uncharacterized protein n=1 Tax=Vibrio tubiashii ATCC 19109 TaxID=1051646 RepID=F9T6R1_9VIBR|nr:hypothetical protein [Vibrio tubiashii]AIW17536.1 hypothetical protein IX91_26115 [Vibrio tubiashii ATCC 19109]EGU54466.1 hypothetical protein VITU9109_02792 [Vibrio tubiashii ATCC 19109]EIF04227.1 hypothetical protein VT1337_09562 [Vibrio tubiashii NCIMB 1337 = ATCC 19106]
MKLFNKAFANLFTAAAVNSQLEKGKSFTYEIQSLCGDYLCTITLDKSVSFAACTAYIELTKNGSVCDSVDGRPCASVADLKDFLRTCFDAWNEENPQPVSTGKAFIVGSDGVSRLLDLAHFNSTQPVSAQTGNRNALTIIRMPYKGKDCFTIANRNVMPQVNVFFQVDSSLFISVEKLLCNLGVANNVVSVNPIRKCGESQDYEVIYNMRESTESQSESLRSIKEIENDKGKKNANTDVFAKYGYTKEKYNKYTIIRDRNGKEITRVSGGSCSHLDVEWLITCALLDGRKFDKQPCEAYKQFEALSVDSKFQLVFPGTAFNAIIDCVKSSVPGSYDCVIKGEPKTLEFNKGWTSASVRTDYDFNTEDLTVEKIHECLDCGFNGIQYISKSSRDKFLNIGIKDEHGRYRLTLDCYDSGKLIKSDSVVTMWDSGIVGLTKQFILDL